jgi:outer membrane receptor protein involved in Fe transport
VFAGVKQSITPIADIFADANYSRRSTSNDASVAIPGAVYVLNYPISVDSYNATLGSRLTPFSNGQFELSANYGRSDTVDGYSFSVGASNPVVGLKIQSRTTTWSVDAKLDGRLGSLSAGPLPFAAGVQYRRETLDYLNVLSANSYKPSRNVAAAYAELRIPLVGPANSGTSLPRIELNLAGRTERYSDFGSTTNPQVGVIWNASGDFRLRGTYGRSFKAPDLYDLNPVPTQIFPEPGSVLGGGPNTIFVNGGNPQLKPERGKTWTIGFDLQPIEIAGLKARLTYYDITFSDLLVTPSDYIDQNHLFNFSSLLGPDILRLNPTNAQIRNLISNPAFGQIGYNVDLSTIGAIFDTRTHNLAVLATKGFDFGASYKTEVARGHLEGGVDGTYIWKFDSQFAPAAPTASILDTPYNPLKWKLRGHVSYACDPVAFNAFINHLNGYANSLVTPSSSVASWTTLDASLIYRIPASVKPFRNATLTLAVINLLNRNPPFLNNAAWPINYDGANANPLGRYLSVQVSLPWQF